MCGRNKIFLSWFIILNISSISRFLLFCQIFFFFFFPLGGGGTQTTLQTVFENHNTRVYKRVATKGYYSHFRR